MNNEELIIRNYEFGRRSGFTLVELLVSIAIFVMFLGVVSVSYFGIVRSQRQANEVRKMYSDVRSLVEMLGEDMRLGTIDYDCYEATSGICPFTAVTTTSSPDQSSYLAIVNKDQTQKVVYWFDQVNGKLKVVRYERPLGSDGAEIANWSIQGADSSQDGRSLFSDMVAVKNLTFAVNPPVNPYASANYAKNQYQFQPKVTLTLTVENANKNAAPFHLDFQTTLSSRVYSRSKS